MNYITDILYWISSGLLVPVVLLLIFFFLRSLLLLGGFFSQYLTMRKSGIMLQKRGETAHCQQPFYTCRTTTKRQIARCNLHF